MLTPQSLRTLKMAHLTQDLIWGPRGKMNRQSLLQAPHSQPQHQFWTQTLQNFLVMK